jgi:ferredoxin
MEFIEPILLLLLIVTAVWMFSRRAKGILGSIYSGRPLNRNDNPGKRLNNLLLVALGQRKMFQRVVPALLHAFIYVGFLLINIEVIGMILDGLTGNHHTLSFLGAGYRFLTASNEVLAFLVIFVCILLLWRRNVSKVTRFSGEEMQLPQKRDANIILYIEIVLMIGLIVMNMANVQLNSLSTETLTGSYPISSILSGVLGTQPATLHLIERIGYWFHLIGIFAFLNYLPFSKHLHILMAFPNTYFFKTESVGKLTSPLNVTHEVNAMLDPSYIVPPAPEGMSFGAKDVAQLSWKTLMDGFTCTECGRCTSACPANLTGKRLSPRKIIMNIRDRQEAILAGSEENKTLLGDYISAEELWACTTCNACVQECPVNIDPVAPILELRRYLVMEQSAAPNSLNAMFTNIENNGSPWAIPAADRFNWAQEIETNQTRN